MSRTVIIDGDILVYRAGDAAMDAFEFELEEDEDYLYKITSYAHKQTAINALEYMIDKICKATNSDEVVICLSDITANFRKEVNPDYKHNRKKAMKPLLYDFIRNYFKNESGYKVFERPTLEADDVIGILATSNKIIKGDKCVWSYDKDFKTIPCKFAKGNPDGSIEKFVISPEEADWWFMYQTLIGDVTDGYSGCKGVGDVTARKILGEIGKKSLKEMWELVKTTYESKGLTEDDALLNARMARILRNTDYDFKGKEIKLWKPED